MAEDLQSLAILVICIGIAGLLLSLLGGSDWYNGDDG